MSKTTINELEVNGEVYVLKGSHSDYWLLKNESNKAFFISWLLYIPLISVVFIGLGLLIASAL